MTYAKTYDEPFPSSGWSPGLPVATKRLFITIMSRWRWLPVKFSSRLASALAAVQSVQELRPGPGAPDCETCALAHQLSAQDELVWLPSSSTKWPRRWRW